MYENFNEQSRFMNCLTLNKNNIMYINTKYFIILQILNTTKSICGKHLNEIGAVLCYLWGFEIWQFYTFFQLTICKNVVIIGCVDFFVF